ncbi:hypothetical protein [Laceyella putida]|uniref:Uncharacterized protein n=1 Tax=Laceyella putida TaxID=110101 RepID=A0ABW2RQY3_9BACL
MKWDAKIYFVHKATGRKMGTTFPINAIDHKSAMQRANEWSKSLTRTGAEVEKIEVIPVDEFEVMETDGPF